MWQALARPILLFYGMALRMGLSAIRQHDPSERNSVARFRHEAQLAERVSKVPGRRAQDGPIVLAFGGGPRLGGHK